MARSRALRHASVTGSVHHVACAFDVDVLVGLRADLAIDAGAMRNGIAAREGGGEFLHIVRADGMKGGIAELADGLIPFVRAAGNDFYLMAFSGERLGEMAADESCSSGDGDFHDDFVDASLINWFEAQPSHRQTARW